MPFGSPSRSECFARIQISKWFIVRSDSRLRMLFLTVHTEGGLLPADILEEIAAGEAIGQQPTDFRLPRTARLTDEIAAAWADARAYWGAFQRGLRRLSEDDPATTVTREQWILPLLRSLGYDQVTFMPRAAVVGNSTYAISHRAGPDESAPPLHIAGCRTDLDRRPPTGRPRLSPHALVQEYLNRTEHLWGIVTNGYRLRLLRDSALMTRPSYVEFDLQQMMTGEHFADFALLYRLVHRSHLPRTMDDATECWLERYYQQALEQGGRVRDRLRDGVEEALLIFGSGFLRHPASADLRRKVREGDLSPQAYYRQLLRLVYRLLFLMVSEERGLVGPEDGRQAEIYRRYYSLSRLRDLAEGYFTAAERHGDLWQALCQTFRLYEDRDLARRFGMETLDGDLFGPHAIPDLERAGLFNADLLRAMRHLSLYREDRVVRRVNYAALDVEELGSVYESLLEYHPVIEERDGRLAFDFVLGSERKTTGSYYTRPELVQELIKSALEPVIEERLSRARTPEEQEAALLAIKVCDPASGSGHFLLAAARRLGRELARVRTGEEHPTPTAFRRAVRDVIRRCIYGVDKNPLAVDLCKVALWLEGHNRGMPLTFLDHRIKCGDSLVGVLDLDVLLDGIPDDAYKPVSGDDKAIARSLKRRNRQEREGQLDLLEQVLPPDLGRLADLWQRLSAEPDADVDAIRRKAQTYEQARAPGSDWWTLWTACNLWTAAFFVPLTRDGSDRVPTAAAVRRYLSNPGAAYGPTVGVANALGVEHPFFHWPLEFPDVFSPRPEGEGPGERAGGFDVVLCNPPWERIKLQEKEFFAARDPQIARAPNKAARERLIKTLRKNNPTLWAAYQRAKHHAEALSKFLRVSGRYPLTARGDINTYSVFAELFTRLVNPTGRVGMIVPIGIATDFTNRDFFAHLVNSRRLQKLVGFENEAFIFPAVHHAFKFCALTVGGEQITCVEPDYVFFCRYFPHVEEPLRHFTLTHEDIARINPNTRTCPIFRTRQDAELTRAIYRRVPVLVSDSPLPQGEGPGVREQNPWGVRFFTMFHMSNDSHLFRTREQLEAQGFTLEGNRFVRDGEVYLPLYEGKMFMPFDHRFADVIVTDNIARPGQPDFATREDHLDPSFVPIPRFWVDISEVRARLGTDYQHKWVLGFKNVTAPTNERTFLATILPLSGVGNSIPLILPHSSPGARHTACLAGNLTCFVFDFTVRQKMGNVNLNFYIVGQLPVLPPDCYTPELLDSIVPRVVELTYTAWDLQPFAQDILAEVGPETWARWFADAPVHTGPPPAGQPATPAPFVWDEERRAHLRAELDALYAHLYGLERDELSYILDTFPIVRRKDEERWGEYRTKWLVLKYYDELIGQII